MEFPSAKNKTFIQAAYQAFDKLRDVLATYHVAKHLELIGDSGMGVLNGWDQYYSKQDHCTYRKFYVEGTLVLVEVEDHNTANRKIYTTDGDQWYGSASADGLRGNETQSPVGYNSFEAA